MEEEQWLEVFAKYNPFFEDLSQFFSKNNYLIEYLLMQKPIITKELAQQLMKAEGEGRGVHFKNDAEYILKKEGPEALKKVEEETERLGFPIKYGEIKTTGFYPAGLRAISLLAIQQALGWDEED